MCNHKEHGTLDKHELVVGLVLGGGTVLVILLNLLLGMSANKTDREILTESAAPAQFSERVREGQVTKIDLSKVTRYEVEGQIVKVRRLDGKVRRVVARNE